MLFGVDPYMSATASQLSLHRNPITYLSPYVILYYSNRKQLLLLLLVIIKERKWEDYYFWVKNLTLLVNSHQNFKWGGHARNLPCRRDQYEALSSFESFFLKHDSLLVELPPTWHLMYPST